MTNNALETAEQPRMWTQGLFFDKKEKNKHHLKKNTVLKKKTDHQSTDDISLVKTLSLTDVY